MNKKNISPPTIMIVFGATGDLMAKKIAPSLFHLHESGQLPKRFQVIGFSRQELSDAEFQERLGRLLKAHKDFSRKRKNFKGFCRKFSYQKGLFENKQDYKKIAQRLEEIDGKWGMCSNKLFYLAVPPKLYSDILKNLSDTKLTEPCGGDKGWSRVIVEKPFGSNLETAKKLEKMLSLLLKEEQIYRIDHYLAKEMLQNILSFRFSNNLFEGVWGSGLIESIAIRLHEKLGVEKRGGFYDGVGALRDVGQNHLLQMLALITMENPGESSPEGIRKNRAKALEAVLTPAREDIIKHSVRAQYTGYRKIKGVKPDSGTETFFKVGAKLNSSRWRGATVTLESGKRLAKQLKEAEITFRHPKPCLCPKRPAKHFKNTLTIQLEPKEGITIRFWSKKPGLKMELEERTFDFQFRYDRARSQYTEEYEKLLLDCIAGDQTLFVSSKEIEEMWRFTDPIIEVWNKNLVPLKFYKPNTNDIVKASIIDEEKIPVRKIKKGISIIGLGKMGFGMAERLLNKGYEISAYDPNKTAREKLKNKGVQTLESVADLTQGLSAPRLVWIMVPHRAVDGVIRELLPGLKKGDTVIDGGNSNYKDSVRRAKLFKNKAINFLDVGVSGGPEGALAGACLMVGGEKRIFKKYQSLFEDLAAPGGYGYMGESGAGHFVKMVHNGIEYGMMQAIAEGFAVMKKSKFDLDLAKVADVYNHKSVIESRLVGWLVSAYKKYGEDFKNVTGKVAHTGEGDWTIVAARKYGVPVAIIKGALDFRKESEKNPSYTGKILSALRNMFGGHSVK